MTYTLPTVIKRYFLNYTGLPKTCLLGIGVHFIEAILSGIFYFLSLYFVNVLHIKIKTAGLIIGCYGIGAIIGSLTAGKLSDRLTPGIVSALCLFILSLGYFTLIFINSIPLLFIDVFFIGVTAYGFLTSNHVWVLKQCSESAADRLKALNILATAANLGISVAAVVVALFSRFGFQYLFLGSSILFFLCACFLLVCDRKYAKPALASELENGISMTNTDASNNKIIYLALLCVLFIGSVVAQLNSTYSLYIQHTFPVLGINAVSILLIINCLMVVFCQTPFVNLFRDYNKILIIGVGAFLIGCGIGILALPPIFILALLSCVIYTVGEMLFFPIAQLICYQKGPKNKKGHSLGMFRMSYAASRVLGPAVGGVIYSAWGGAVLWAICCFIGILSLGGCLYYKKYA